MEKVPGREWESLKRLAAYDAANGWPWDIAWMLVIYGLLRLIGFLVPPPRSRREFGARRRPRSASAAAPGHERRVGATPKPAHGRDPDQRADRQ